MTSAWISRRAVGPSDKWTDAYGTILTENVASNENQIVVADPSMFQAGDSIIVGSPLEGQQTVEIDSINNGTITLTGNVGQAYSVNAPVMLPLANVEGEHPDLASHNTLGLATDLELSNHGAGVDPHPVYVLESLFDTKGDILAASADNTPAKVAVGDDGTVLIADAASPAGVKWDIAPAGSPSGDAGGVLSGTYPNPGFASDMATQAELDTHAADADAHHDEDHATRHGSGGDDAVKLDDLAAPDDNTDLDASDTKHGLLPKLSGDSGDVLKGDGTWAAESAGGGGAPTDADYLVGTANGDLSNEIVVGTTPGGELGNTWASPTVDANHGGGTHAATQAAAEATAATALAGHTGDAADAHDASAISIADAGNDFTATDVEGALDELQADNETHAADDDAHHDKLHAHSPADGSGEDLTPTTVFVTNDDTAQIPLKVKAVASQTADLAQFLRSNGGIMVRVRAPLEETGIVHVAQTFTNAPTDFYAGLRSQLVAKGTSTIANRTMGVSAEVTDHADVVNKTVSGAANNGSGLIRITTSAAHGWATDDRIGVYGVTGTTEANGWWAITVVDTTHFDLQGSTFANAYVSGGTATNRPMLTGVRISVGPALDRGGLTGTAVNGDDVVGVSVVNAGAGKATDAFYIANGSPSGSGWTTGFNVDDDVDYAFITGVKTIGVGLDLRQSTFSTAAIRIPNNTPVSALTAASATQELFRLNASDQLAFTSKIPGIPFPATQVPSADANTLDDYEENTWTPGVSFGGGTTGITYTNQQGSYTKIGRLVFFRLRLTLSAKGSSTGTALITGLPFTHASAPATSFTVSQWANFTSITNPITARGNASATTIALNQNGVTALTEANFQNTSDIFVSGCYEV